MLRRYVNWVVKWPKAIIAVVALVTLVLAAFIGKVQILLDLDAQIPPGHPMVQVGKRIESLFGGKYTMVIVVYVENGTIYDPKILAKIERINDKLERVPGIKPGSVISLMSDRLKDVLSTEEALEVSPLAKEVPKSPKDIAEFRERVKRNHVMTSLLVSEDGKSTSISADFEDFEKAGGAKHVFPKREEILAPEREAGVEIVSAGSPSVLYWLLVYTRRVALLFALALAMIGYLHYRAFRTIQGMIVPLVTALMGVVWALGLMGLIGAP